MRRLRYRALRAFNRKAKVLAASLVPWTGKHPVYCHPKHFLRDWWYLPYVRGRVLDVGCGTGMHARRVGGIGIDRPMVDLEEGLPIKSGIFDTVLCLDVLEHVVHRPELVAELRRVLTPGGTLLLSVPNRDTRWKRRLRAAGLDSRSDPDHKHEYTLSELDAELRCGDFRIVSCLPDVYDTPWVGLIDLAGGCSLPLYRWLTQQRRRRAARFPLESAGFCVVAR